ncbi:MAG: DUF2061 domain-containing protein [Bdellovibrionales bacterium]
MFNKTLYKTISYAFMHMSLAILVAYALSGRWEVASAIGLIEPCVQTVAFFFHEQAWHSLEQRRNQKDYHDSVIDSVSPASHGVEVLLRENFKEKGDILGLAFYLERNY